jgi:hypothetical protein
MKVYYDTADNNQVQAVYTNDTGSTEWAAYSEASVDAPALQAEVLQYMRDCRVTVVDGIVTAVTQHDHPVDHGLDANRAAKIVAIDEKTEHLLSLGYSYDGNTFSMSIPAQVKMIGLVTAHSAGILVDPDHYPVNYACLDETEYLIVDSASLLAMYGAGFTRMRTVCCGGADLKQQCLDATTQAELDAVVDNRT